MNGNFIKLFGILIFACVVSCKDSWFADDDKLVTKRTPYTGTQLKINGYYYHKYAVSEGTFRYSIYFFYNNGTVLYGESPTEAELGGHENDYRSGAFYNRAKSYKYCWGLYKADGNSMLFERWFPGDPPLKSYSMSGDILNDTTFHITKSTRSDGGEEKSRNEIFRFKAFDPKPESFNVFAP